jgi:RecA-family ATPase
VACPEADASLAEFFLDTQPPEPGHVLYFNAEDPPDELEDRLKTIGERLPPEHRAKTDEYLRVVSGYGHMLNLGSEGPDGTLNDDILRLATAYKGYRLIVLDTLSRFHALDENKNDQMAGLISKLEFVANQTGAAVIFMHHTSKGASREGQESSQTASRGASVLTYNLRYSAFLQGMAENEAEKYGITHEKRKHYLRFGVAKQNYGSPQADRWYERKEGGMLTSIKLDEIPKPKNKKGDWRDED